ncbi:MAG: hypothetical protein LQ350_000715 [Teloschistes chrysophthalmus]|nr:MAG: hypothetical protein LQ350_000715 [Niorma chrysophthalma]
MLNGRGSTAAVAAANVFQSSNTSDAGSVLQSMSGHTAEFPSRSSRPLQALPYQSNNQLRSSQGDVHHPMPLLTSSPDIPRMGFENGYTHSPNHHSEDQQQSGQTIIPGVSIVTEAVKAFACGNCGKGFARRSDLARHVTEFEIIAIDRLTDAIILCRSSSGLEPTSAFIDLTSRNVWPAAGFGAANAFGAPSFWEL